MSPDAPDCNALEAALETAIDAAEDLHALHQYRRELAYRWRLARLKAELTWLDADEQDALATELAQFTALVVALSERRATT
jgi:hypothetical protein